MNNYILNSSQYSILLESHNNIEGGNASDLIELGKIRMSDGNIVDGSDFVDVVNGGLMLFKNKYPYEYKYIRNATIIYLLDDLITDTMCVDNKMVYYINVGFLYNKPPFGLGMKSESVFKILYHEAMHSMLAHIPRMHSYNEANSIKANWKDLNIAGDLEINDMMVGDKICDDNFWREQGGCYDPVVAGLPMETIISDFSNVVDKFKSKPQRHNPNKNNKNKQDDDNNGNNEKGNKIATSTEWKDGHREGRELIRKLYKAMKRNATATLDEFGDIFLKNGGDMNKVADELKKRFPNI